MIAAFETALAHARLQYVGLALLVYAISVPLAALRWRQVLRGLNQRLPLRRLILANLAASFVNNVTPAARVSGEACRVVALVRAGLSTVASTASVAYERLSEAPAIGVLAIVTVLALGHAGTEGRVRSARLPVSLNASRLLIATVVAIALGAAAFWRSGVIGRWTRAIRVGRASLFEAARITPSALVASATLSSVLWALDVIRLRIAAAAIRAPIGLREAAALSAITIVAGMVPTLGGLGAVEGGLVAGLIGFGVAPADAAAVTAIERGISYGLVTIAGAAALSVLGGRTLWEAARKRTETNEDVAR